MKFAEPRRRAQFPLLALLQVIVLLAATISLPGVVIAQDGDTATDQAPANESASPTPAPDPFVAPPTKQEAAKQVTDKQATTKQPAKQATTKQPAKKTPTDTSKQAKATPQAAADRTLRLYPKNVRLALTQNSLVSAWSCPANDKTPFGKDKEPGTADDDCSPIKVRWSLGAAAAAHITQAVGAKTRVILDAPVRTKLIARWNGQKRTARVTPQALPLSTETQEATPAPAKVAPLVALVDEPTAEPTTQPTAEPTTEPTPEPSAEASPAADPSVEEASPAPSDSLAPSGVTERRVILPAALAITVKDHQGQKPDGSWTNGLVSGYTAGNTINFRFSVTATAAGSGTFEIQYTANDGCSFFIQSLALGNVGISTAPPVSPPGSNISLTLGSNTLVSGKWVQVINAAATAAGTVTGSYHLTLSANANTCSNNGASAIAGETGAVQVSGKQNVPVSGTIAPIPTATITVVKDAKPDGDQSFGYTGGLGAFSLVDDGSVTNTQTFNDLAPGSYAITESVVSGWILSQIAISGDSDGGSSQSLATRAATIDLDAGEDITVTFTNDQRGSITIIKDAQPEGDQSFGFTASGSGVSNFSLVDDGTATNTQVFSDLTPGNYSVAETVPSGWDLTGLVCTGGGTNTSTSVATATIGLDQGETVVCTFTNTAQRSALTLIKHVVNDNGGTELASAWDLSAGANTVTGAEGGAFATAVAGTYALSESAGPDGYTNTSITCDDDPGVEVTAVTLGLGETITCTFVNDDDAPSLTLIKHVVNDNGGTELASAWTLSAGDNDVTGSETGALATDQAGTYALSESTVAGYTNTSITCDDDPGVEVTSVTLGLGEDVTCTFVNDDNAPALYLAKHVVNDNGGTAVAGDWDLSAGANTVTGSETGALATDQAGSYDLSESTVAGYTNTSITCDDDLGVEVTSVTVGLGEDVTCTFVNDDVAPGLTLIKHVVNDNGGTAVAGDWTLSAGDNDVTGSETGALATDQAGTYALSESAVSGYTNTSITCDDDPGVEVTSVTVGPGDSVICTFVNDDDAPALYLHKVVQNDNGGTAVAGDWDLSAGANTVTGSESGALATARPAPTRSARAPVPTATPTRASPVTTIRVSRSPR